MSRHNCWSLIGAQELKSFCLMGPVDDIESFLKTYFVLRNFRVIVLDHLAQLNQQSFFDQQENAASVYVYRIHAKPQKELKSLHSFEQVLKTKKLVFLAEKIFFKDRALVGELPCFEWTMPNLREWRQLLELSSPGRCAVSSVPETVGQLEESLRLYHYDLDIKNVHDLTMIEGNAWEKLNFLFRAQSLITTLSLQEMQHLSHALDHVETVTVFASRAPKPLPGYLVKNLILKKEHLQVDSLEIYQKFLLALSQGNVLSAQEALKIWIANRAVPHSE